MPPNLRCMRSSVPQARVPETTCMINSCMSTGGKHTHKHREKPSAQKQKLRTLCYAFHRSAGEAACAYVEAPSDGEDHTHVDTYQRLRKQPFLLSPHDARDLLDYCEEERACGQHTALGTQTLNRAECFLVLHPRWQVRLHAFDPCQGK